MADDLNPTSGNPALAAGLGIGANFLGNAGSSLAQGRALREEAKVKEQNARLLDEAAIDARQRGFNRSDEINREVVRKIGEQTAALAANGILVGEGSALDLVTETAGLGAVDALTALQNAEQEARQFVLEAEANRIESEAKRDSASSTEIFGVIGAGASALGQAAAVKRRQDNLKVPDKKKEEDK